MRIISEEKSFVIPIHAYPILNDEESLLPSKIDFGSIPVGSTIEKSITIGNKVPISFEFYIELGKNSDEFSISIIRRSYERANSSIRLFKIKIDIFCKKSYNNYAPF